mgnify:CR=1 FL=1
MATAHNGTRGGRKQEGDALVGDLGAHRLAVGLVGEGDVLAAVGATGDLGRVHGDDEGRVGVDLAARAGDTVLLREGKPRDRLTVCGVTSSEQDRRRTVYQVPLPEKELEVERLTTFLLEAEDEDELLFLLHWLPDLV